MILSVCSTFGSSPGLVAISASKFRRLPVWRWCLPSGLRQSTTTIQSEALKLVAEHAERAWPWASSSELLVLHRRSRSGRLPSGAAALWRTRVRPGGSSTDLRNSQTLAVSRTPSFHLWSCAASTSFRRHGSQTRGQGFSSLGAFECQKLQSSQCVHVSPSRLKQNGFLGHTRNYPTRSTSQ